MNYTHAYSTFAMRSCLNPELPNNYGSLAPIKVTAPEGCIVNGKYPAPVNARHVVGMYVPMPILKALYHVMPDRVLAEGSGAVWTIQIQGKNADGEPFTSSMFNYSGGMGARRTKSGPIGDLLSDRRRRGAGRSAGSLDADRVRPKELRPRLRRRRRVPRRRRSDHRLAHAHQRALAAQRRPEPHELWRPKASTAARPARPAASWSTAKPVTEARKMMMQPNDEVTLETPGGGGYGRPTS